MSRVDRAAIRTSCERMPTREVVNYISGTEIDLLALFESRRELLQKLPRARLKSYGRESSRNRREQEIPTMYFNVSMDRVCNIARFRMIFGG
jgi:hypothetical protein